MSAPSAAPDLFFIGAGRQDTPLTPELAGSKAANLWQMAKLGLKVPPAFVLSTRLCQPINAGDSSAEERLRQLLAQGIAELERATGRIFGDARVPLLVSVRSGAARSMPGMLDTILNIGMNQETVHGLIRITGNPRLAWDSYRRFVQSYAEVTGNTGSEAFAARLALAMTAEGIECEAELDPEALERLTANYLDEAADLLGQPVPADPRLQLEAAAKAVYRSWGSEKANEYRRLNKLEQARRHRGHGASDGVRERRRTVWRWRCLHAQPGDGRQGTLRRFPLRCAGRGRCRRAQGLEPSGVFQGALARSRSHA